MLWQPGLATETLYSDNIRATRVNKQADLALSLTPSLTVKTINPEHGFTGSVALNSLQFKHYDAQDQFNAALTVAPYYQFGAGWAAHGSAGLQFAHELVSAETAQPLANKPTPYQQTHLDAHLTHAPAHLTTDIFAAADMFNFENTNLINGQHLVNDDRDHTDGTAGAEFGWQTLSQDTKIGWRNEILQQIFTRNDFNNATQAYNGFDRDNHGWRSQLTFDVRPTHLIYLTGRAGLEQKSFKNPWSDKRLAVGPFARPVSADSTDQFYIGPGSCGQCYSL